MAGQVRGDRLRQVCRLARGAVAGGPVELNATSMAVYSRVRPRDSASWPTWKPSSRTRAPGGAASIWRTDSGGRDRGLSGAFVPTMSPQRLARVSRPARRSIFQMPYGRRRRPPHRGHRHSLASRCGPQPGWAKASAKMCGSGQAGRGQSGRQHFREEPGRGVDSARLRSLARCPRRRERAGIHAHAGSCRRVRAGTRSAFRVQGGRDVGSDDALPAASDEADDAVVVGVDDEVVVVEGLPVVVRGHSSGSCGIGSVGWHHVAAPANCPCSSPHATGTSGEVLGSSDGRLDFRPAHTTCDGATIARSKQV